MVIIWQQVAEEDLRAEHDNETGNETINFAPEPCSMLSSCSSYQLRGND